MDDDISTMKEKQVDTLFKHLSVVDVYIKFHIESPGNDGSISALGTMSLTNADNSKTGVSITHKPSLTITYIVTQSTPTSTKKSVVNALMCRAKNMCLTPQILPKKMDYPHCLLLKNNYPEWIIKEPEKKSSTPIINPENGNQKESSFL